jgi:cyanophycinase-like exopeptidase
MCVCVSRYDIRYLVKHSEDAVNVVTRDGAMKIITGSDLIGQGNAEFLLEESEAKKPTHIDMTTREEALEALDAKINQHISSKEKD